VSAAATKQLLLAEDDAHIAKLVEFILTKRGYEVTAVADGTQAIARLDEKSWDLILLDVMMPGADGWTVLRSVRASDGLKNVPVLMLTAKGSHKDIATAAELGVDDYLTKPFDPDVLFEKVKKLLGE